MGDLIAASTASRTAAPRLAGALLRTQPDRRLAELAGEGSEPAFEEMVRRYRGGLIGFAARISSMDSADDVVQDSMVKAHQALVRGDRPDAPRAWLFRIVRNTALNDRRDRRVHEQLDENYDGVEQPPEAAERRGQLRTLLAAIGALPRAQRVALVQRELEGRGHDEIAAALEVSPGAVRQLIFRARSALRAGIGALVPMQLLRAAVLSGATEQAGPGAAATGAGIAAKLGIGALVTTGALVAGTHEVKDQVGIKPDQQIAIQAVAPSQAKGSAVTQAHSAAVSGRVHRTRLIVAPRSTPVRHAATPTSPSPAHSSPAPHNTAPYQGGSTPPPTGGGGGGGTSGGGLPPGGGGGGAQTYSAPSTRDCQSSGGGDPAPPPVSPG